MTLINSYTNNQMLKTQKQTIDFDSLLEYSSINAFFFFINLKQKKSSCHIQFSGSSKIARSWSRLLFYFLVTFYSQDRGLFQTSSAADVVIDNDNASLICRYTKVATWQQPQCQMVFFAPNRQSRKLQSKRDKLFVAKINAAKSPRQRVYGVAF